ncbi:MAG: hypothetical protein K0S24_4959 [Sphingobacterium sp.]|nr:hypothetical protein [Sphingobacterium sp.]
MQQMSIHFLWFVIDEESAGISHKTQMINTNSCHLSFAFFIQEQTIHLCSFMIHFIATI